VKHPDDRLFPNFDEGPAPTRWPRRRELFFGAIVREIRSLFDLLRATSRS
jgi:hypothetical protein